MSERVFCYGTLKRGYGNHSLLRDSKFIGEAETQPILTMVDLGSFPAVLLNSDGETAVKGEVYEVNEATMQQLDWLEGHPNFYRRVQVSTNLGPVWIYTLPPEKYRNYTEIPSGVWEGRNVR